MQVTIRKIANGYLVLVPPSPGNGMLPSPVGFNETYVPDLSGVGVVIGDVFEPIPSNHNQE